MTDSDKRRDLRNTLGDDPFGAASRGFAERVAPHDAAKDTAREVTVGSTEYGAYGYRPGGAPDCDVRGWTSLRPEITEGVCFDYRMLMRIGYGGLAEAPDPQQPERGNMYLRLFLPECIIQIEGFWLNDLRARLRQREVTFIQQYSPMVYRTPLRQLPEGETVITDVIIGHPGHTDLRTAH